MLIKVRVMPGLVPEVSLTGSLLGVEFMQDSSDELEIYIDVRHTP
jgi:hypothetical protein